MFLTLSGKGLLRILTLVPHCQAEILVYKRRKWKKKNPSSYCIFTCKMQGACSVCMIILMAICHHWFAHLHCDMPRRTRDKSQKSLNEGTSLWDKQQNLLFYFFLVKWLVQRQNPWTIGSICKEKNLVKIWLGFISYK